MVENEFAVERDRPVTLIDNQQIVVIGRDVLKNIFQRIDDDDVNVFSGMALEAAGRDPSAVV
jgi:hypothetical protein